MKNLIMCDAGQSDGTFDSQTFYGYLDNGRKSEERLVDDSGRSDLVTYAFDKNGNPTRIGYPSGSTADAVYTYGSSNASDDDKVRTVSRDTTEVVWGVAWMPFGPVSSYTQANAWEQSNIVVDWSYNLAYRNTLIRAHHGATDDTSVTFAEDANGRYTQYVIGTKSSGEQDLYLKHDALDRLTCRTTTAHTSCPTSDDGDAVTENMAYNASGDRTVMYRENSLVGFRKETTSYVGGTSPGTNKIDTITYPASNANTIAFTWDGRGNRLLDDDSAYTGSNDDERTYLYDALDRLRSVTNNRVVGGAMHQGVTSFAYDEKNRLIFQSDHDIVTGLMEQRWFSYDQQDRLIQVKHVPDASNPSAWELEHFYWLDRLPIYNHSTQQSGDLTVRRFNQMDEQGKPYKQTDWPFTGFQDEQAIWWTEQAAFGWDIVKSGNEDTNYQPFRMGGQLVHLKTEAQALSGSATQRLRSAIWASGGRGYDSFAGAYLQEGAGGSAAFGMFSGSLSDAVASRAKVYTEDDPVPRATPAAHEASGVSRAVYGIGAWDSSEAEAAVEILERAAVACPMSPPLTTGRLAAIRLVSLTPGGSVESLIGRPKCGEISVSWDAGECTTYDATDGFVAVKRKNKAGCCMTACLCTVCDTIDHPRGCYHEGHTGACGNVVGEKC